LIRITGGDLKGRMAGSLVKSDLRPTTSFFREWIFNVLSNLTDIDGIKLLDLFAGTGIVSFEFLSRGAVSSVMVDNDPKIVSLIKNNIRSLSLTNASAVTADSGAYISNLFSSKNEFPFNAVFIDAPYSKFQLAENVLDIIYENSSRLPDDFLIIVESPKEKSIVTKEGFEMLKQKLSGTTSLSIIRRSE
jgi:16S rRNA (guanine966-N2)-methyltransferase